MKQWQQHRERPSGQEGLDPGHVGESRGGGQARRSHADEIVGAGVPVPARSLGHWEGAGQAQEGQQGWVSPGPAPPTDCDPHCPPSLISGLASLDAKTSSRLGVLTVAYYLWTTFVAVIVGIIMVSIIHPGRAAQKEATEQSGKPIMSSADALLDLIR